MLAALLAMTMAAQPAPSYDEIAECYVYTLHYSRDLSGTQSEEMYSATLEWDRRWRTAVNSAGFNSIDAAYEDLNRRADAYTAARRSNAGAVQDRALACYSAVRPNVAMFSEAPAPLPVTFEESVQCYAAILSYTQHDAEPDPAVGRTLAHWDRFMTRAGEDAGMKMGAILRAMRTQDDHFDEMAQSDPETLEETAATCAARTGEITATATPQP